MTTMNASSGPGMKVYVTVWLGMLGIAAAHVSGGTLLAALIVLSFLEAAIALRYFMHLKYEVPLLFWTLIPALLLAFLMMNQFWADSARMNTFRFP